MSSPLNYGTPSSRSGTPRTPGALGTPHRPRPDIRGERRGLTVNVHGSEVVRLSFLYIFLNFYFVSFCYWVKGINQGYSKCGPRSRIRTAKEFPVDR